MILLQVAGIFYLLILIYSWIHIFQIGAVKESTTIISKFLFLHGQYTALFLVLFVIWTVAHAAGHILATSIFESGW